MKKITISKESLESFGHNKNVVGMTEKTTTEFVLDVDITMSKRVYIKAENEQDAVAIFERMMYNDPYEVATKFDAYVDYEVTEVNEA